VVHIPRDIQLSAKGHAAYNKALDDHGDVVIIPRHGRLEYVVDYQHVHQVLTDSTSYSFERAVTKMLHLEFMLWFKGGTFIQDLFHIIQDGVSPRLNAVICKISPVLDKEACGLQSRLEDGEDQIKIQDMYTWVHYAIAQAMIVLVIGDQYSTPKMTQHFTDIVVAISDMTGMYENTQGWKYFPRLWSIKTTIVAIFGTILPKFFSGVLPQIWKNREAHLDHGINIESTEFSPFLDLLLAKHRDKKTGRLTFLNFIWCSVICLGIIFASIHQTAVVAVWCIFNLAKRQQDYLPEIRQEISENIQFDDDGASNISLKELGKLHKMDSFIREVMRTKGDTFAGLRYTTKDVQVGKYMIPKNSLCAPYVKRVHERQSARFDGFQWCKEDGRSIPAVQGSNDFISFGLGRWACPGRHLAIAEIKIILVSLFGKFDVNLEGNDFTTSDPMNTTSVAPQAVVYISKRK
jgi:hypothetical protein